VILVDSDGAETVLTKTTHYAITSANANRPLDLTQGGTVTTVETYSSDYTIWLRRNTTKSATLDIDDEDVEEAIDKLTYMAQDLYEMFARCIHIQVSEAGATTKLGPAGTAGYVYRRADGDFTTAQPMEVGDANISTYMETVLDDANAPEARSTLDVAKRHWIDVTEAPYNATGDGATDDTVAIQAAIDAAHAERLAGTYEPIVWFPDGEYATANLTIYNGTRLVGAGMHHSYLSALAGTVGNYIEDDASAAGIWIENLCFDGKNHAGLNGLELGWNGTPFGAYAAIRNVYIRNFTGYGARINGNVAYVDMVEISACGDTGLIISGSGNHYTRIGATNCEPYSIRVTGDLNFVSDVHLEGDPDYHIYVANTVSGLSLSNILCTIASGNDPNAVVYINGAALVTVDNLLCSIAAPSTLPDEYIIHDASLASVRQTNGDKYSTVYSILHYASGTGYGIPWGGSAAPTDGRWIAGDWVVNQAPAAGEQIGWLCIASGAPGTWTPFGCIPGPKESHTADDVLTAAESGTRHDNTGAGAVVTLTLPNAAAGLRWHFVRRNATHALRIDVDGGDAILPGAADKYLSLDTNGASVTIEYHAGNYWIMSAQTGTISFEK
jgi:hypothetical protein